MSHKVVRKMVFSVLLGGLAAVMVAPPAHANRGNYVPPIQQTETPEEDTQPTQTNTDVLGEDVDLPVVTDPVVTDPVVDASGGDSPAPLVPQADPGPGAVSAPEVAPVTDAAPALPRTGAFILPLARAGVAVLSLGLGLVFMARRRRAMLA